MAHAHPTTDGNLSQPASRPNSLFRTSPAADPVIIRNPSFQPPQERFNPNSRRLQLRNAGFRGTALPTRRISPFGSSSAVSELSPRHTNEENSPRTAEKRATYGENLPSSPVSILQELSNSSRRRGTPRPSLVGIFEDADTKENKPPDLKGSSWLNEAGVDSSPAARPGTPLKMTTIRKVPLQEKENNPPPQSSPILKQNKGRRKVRSNTRSTSFDASRYIEHLESELAALNTRVDALTCPTATKAQGAKVRALTNQVRSLRLEVSGWENKFEERVADEVVKRSEVEADLRRALRRLEHEKEAKDVRIQELEVEFEHAQVKVREADSLATTNHDLEKRVDTLTQLLAQSPTRQEYQYPFPSPDKVAFAQRTSRPRSLLPCIPSSPVVPRRLSLNVPLSKTWRSLSFQSTNSILETPEEGTPPKANDDTDVDDSTPQPNPRSRPTSETVSFGSTSIESGALTSRPTSITSSTSSASAPWSSSHSSQAHEDSRLASRARRMRRFPSGTGSLKPLILPTSIAGPSLPTSAPLTRTGFASSQDFSDSYFDPASTFSSIAEIANLSSPVSTPSQPLRRRSASWARNQALNALEGKPYSKGDEEDETPNHCSDFTLQTCATSEAKHDYHTCTKSEETPPRQRLSLEFELSNIASTFNTPDVDPEKPRDASLDPNAASPLSSQSSILSLRTPSVSAPTCFETPSRARHHPSLPAIPVLLARTESEPSYRISKGRQYHVDTTVPQAQSQPLMSRTADSSTAVAFFSRLTALVTSIRDPTLLARRILHNAWTRTSTPKAHGGLGWWLMGLVYRSYHGFQRSDSILRGPSEEEDDRFSAGRRDSNIDWHQFYSTEASKQRRIRAFIGDGAFARNEEDQICDLKVSSQVQNPNEENAEILRQSEATYLQQPMRCKDCIEPPARRSLRLWLRFSLAVVLAIGVAIKDGPGALLSGDEGENNEIKDTTNECVNARDENTRACSTEEDSKYGAESMAPSKTPKQRHNMNLKQEDHEALNLTENASTKDDDEEYWGWELTFRNYTAEDFEDGKEPVDSPAPG